MIMKEKFDINSIEDFNKIDSSIRAENFHPGPDGHYYLLFRGQSKDSYNLRPSIARYVDSVDELKDLEKGIVTDIKNLIKEKEWFKNIIQLTKNENPYKFENEWRLLGQIQHLGLPTRLLDWTIRFKTALYFAVNNNHSDAGQLWVYKVPREGNHDIDPEVSPYETEKHCIINNPTISSEGTDSKVAERRKASQTGQFTFLNTKNSLLPMEELLLLKDKIDKYTINPKSKKEILGYLSNKGITKDFLYANTDYFNYKKLEVELNKIKEKYNLV